MIYANGSVIKDVGSESDVTWHVGDKIRLTNDNMFGSPLFSMWTVLNSDMDINVSYSGIAETDATNQMINVYNGNKYILRSEANEWVGTQAEYDAIAVKNPNIIYYITE